MKSQIQGSVPQDSIPPVVLAILDGWGYREEAAYNAVRTAETPIMDSLWDRHPHTLIDASGAAVGLPDDQMGNSEVGHLTIGSGRVIRQELVRIGQAVSKGQLLTNSALSELAATLRADGGRLHLIGLCSDGGVHSHIDHLGGLLRWAAQENLPRVCIHVITDGRDTPPSSALTYLTQLREQIAAAGVGAITTICGRFWAMDRDNRWDRTEKAYRLLTEADDLSDRTPEEALEQAYAEGTTDEFLEPVRFSPEVIAPGDGVICFNFRPDRVRQLIRALVLKDFEPFQRELISPLHVVTFTQYEKGLPVTVAFPPESLDGLLGQVVSENGLLQLRTAETEKYPHVTYFMNGGIEKAFPGEERQLVRSPMVATYDEAPAMSALQLTDSCISAIKKGIYSLIIINYANPDMVGHTGKMDAAIEAIRTVDACVGRLVEATTSRGGTILITADHGNAELMRAPDGRPWTAHTTNPVPVILVQGDKQKGSDGGHEVELRSGGGLSDIAPTLLDVLGLPKPSLMTGQSLIERASLAAPSGRVPKTVVAIAFSALFWFIALDVIKQWIHPAT